MIIYASIQNIPDKVWTDSFVAINLHPHHRMTFPDWIKKISPAVKTGETAYFRNHEGSYYDVMPSLWKNMYVTVRREVMCIIDRFFREAPPGESPWTKENVMSLVCFFSLEEILKIKICHMLEKDHPEVIEGRQRLIAVDVLDSE